jgi:O-antigen/teichoic acid export membrane protein
MVAKVCGAANLFVSVPFVLQALGTERFGVWATLCAFATISGFLDFGFGNGAMNLISSARGRNASHEYPLIVAAAYRAIASSTAWVGAATCLIWLVVPWGRLLGLPPEFANECRFSAAAALGAMLLAVPLGLATRVQLALGRGERAYRWQAIANLLALGIVIVLALSQASLFALTAAAVGMPLLGLLMNTIDLRRVFHVPDPSFARVPPLELVAEMRRIGLKFFVLQLSATLAFSIDLPLVTALLGPASAANFTIAQRLFSIIPMGLSLLWVPLWPTYRNALAAGDYTWVARTFRYSLVVAIGLSIVCGAILLVGFEPISRLWLGKHVAVSTLLLLGFALWCVLDAAGGAIATFLNAAGIMRPQLIIAITFVALSLPLKVAGASIYGLDAIIWVTACLCLLVNLTPLYIIRHKLIEAVWAKTH